MKTEKQEKQRKYLVIDYGRCLNLYGKFHVLTKNARRKIQKFDNENR